MTYAKTRDGAHLYVKDWGRGAPVVAGHRVIAYDGRGLGRSDQRAIGWSAICSRSSGTAY
jgi:pimeloyl-ACP methyl ester carboxylesterase